MHNIKEFIDMNEKDFDSFFNILDTSHISTMNVDFPPAKSSDAPILVNILSQTDILALLAGTNDPI